MLKKKKGISASSMLTSPHHIQTTAQRLFAHRVKYPTSAAKNLIYRTSCRVSSCTMVSYKQMGFFWWFLMVCIWFYSVYCVQCIGPIFILCSCWCSRQDILAVKCAHTPVTQMGWACVTIWGVGGVRHGGKRMCRTICGGELSPLASTGHVSREWI